MEVGILSMRYAKAIIEYAQEKGLEDRLYQEFLTLSHSFCEQPGLREALDNPVITTKEKLALVCTAADGDGKSTREFVHYRLDASVATQLKRVKQQFIDKNRRIV
ncbi:MAG: F0F1 ATP synthase subunit delta [Bacteroides sp.]|nr:F0F1 ATP synthase subunit delta [Bacteroides sp.]